MMMHSLVQLHLFALLYLTKTFTPTFHFLSTLTRTCSIVSHHWFTLNQEPTTLMTFYQIWTTQVKDLAMTCLFMKIQQCTGALTIQILFFLFILHSPLASHSRLCPFFLMTFLTVQILFFLFILHFPLASHSQLSLYSTLMLTLIMIIIFTNTVSLPPWVALKMRSCKCLYHMILM